MTGLNADLMLAAYAAGVFPMAERRDAETVIWVDPTRRGVFPLQGFHISKSLARRMRRGGYCVHLNRDFDATLAACADREETWINADLTRVYRNLHDRGAAHSWEIRDPSGGLWGATFGIAMGGAWFGESMVSLATDGSKLALAHLVDHLRRCGFTLFDTQFLTPHLRSLGAVEIPRSRYRAALATALTRPADLSRHAPDQDGVHVLQRMTQTS